MEDENKRQILQAMTRLMLQFCRDGVASITIHADMVDGTPFVSAIALSALLISVGCMIVFLTALSV